MRITFLVGNGFDLNCGLHTQYSDFYKYFIEKHPQNTIACEIADNPENWADLELSIGKYIEKVSGENRETFLNDLAELEEELRDYLQSENQRIVIGNEIGGEFHDKVVCFFDGMRPVDKADIANLRRSTTNSFQYTFVTFNYTDVLDQIVEKIKKSGTFDKRTVNGCTILDDLEPVLHVHGTLSDALVLGLNDESQICNEQLKDDLTLHETIVKPKVNELLGESRTDKVKHFIDESRYVCVFGLSLGETDKIWWEYIGQWLQGDQNHRLVLFVLEKTPSRTIAMQEILRKRKWQELFLKKAGIENENVKNRIIIIENSDIFTMENVKLKVLEPIK